MEIKKILLMSLCFVGLHEPLHAGYTGWFAKLFGKRLNVAAPQSARPASVSFQAAQPFNDGGQPEQDRENMSWWSKAKYYFGWITLRRLARSEEELINHQNQRFDALEQGVMPRIHSLENNIPDIRQKLSAANNEIAGMLEGIKKNNKQSKEAAIALDAMIKAKIAEFEQMQDAHQVELKNLALGFQERAAGEVQEIRERAVVLEHQLKTVREKSKRQHLYLRQDIVARHALVSSQQAQLSDGFSQQNEEMQSIKRRIEADNAALLGLREQVVSFDAQLQKLGEERTNFQEAYALLKSKLEDNQRKRKIQSALCWQVLAGRQENAPGIRQRLKVAERFNYLKIATGEGFKPESAR